MIRNIFLALVIVNLFGCGSDEDSPGTFLNVPSAEIVSVSSGDIPEEADLVIIWFLPDPRNFDEYVTGSGSLANGSFSVEPPNPIPDVVISQRYGVATGLILAFAKGEAPTPGPYSLADFPTDNFFDRAIGVVNNHAIIYRHAAPDPILFPDPSIWWGSQFDDGYSCARSIAVEGDFDQFEPTECSSMVLSIGVVDEIEIVGGDWY